MKRYVKVLATSTLLGVQAIPGYVGVATAQSTLPPVTVSHSCPSGQVRVYQDRNFLGCGNVSDYSSGGGSGGGSIPEGEAIVNGRWAPAPPPAPVPPPPPPPPAHCQATYDRSMQIATKEREQGSAACADVYRADMAQWHTRPFAGAQWDSCKSRVKVAYDSAFTAAEIAITTCR